MPNLSDYSSLRGMRLGFALPGFFSFSIFTTTLSALAADLVGAISGKLGVPPDGAASHAIPSTITLVTTGVRPNLILQYSDIIFPAGPETA